MAEADKTGQPTLPVEQSDTSVLMKRLAVYCAGGFVLGFLAGLVLQALGWL